MFITLLLVGVGVMFIVLTIRADSFDKGLAIFGTTAYWLVFIVFALVAVLCNKTCINQMHIFQDVDRVNFERVITETLSYVEPENVTSLGVEKFEVYKVVSDRLSELTIQIKEYNNNLAGYRVLEDSLLVNWYIPSLEGLEYIKLNLP